MTVSDARLKRLLDFDGLAAAEDILGGENYDAVTAAGWLLMRDNMSIKEAALIERDDTLMDNTIERYQRIVGEMGFEPVLELSFQKRAKPEKQFIYARRDGLLLSVDTFTWEHEEEPGINGGKVYYNWVPATDDYYRYTSSGSWLVGPDNELICYCGDHDAREALRFKMESLEKHGSFLPKWRKRPFLWLLNHGDTEDAAYDYVALNAARIALLPQWVQDMITPEGQQDD